MLVVVEPVWDFDEVPLKWEQTKENVAVVHAPPVASLVERVPPCTESSPQRGRLESDLWVFAAHHPPSLSSPSHVTQAFVFLSLKAMIKAPKNCLKTVLNVHLILKHIMLIYMLWCSKHISFLILSLTPLCLKRSVLAPVSLRPPSPWISSLLWLVSSHMPDSAQLSTTEQQF